MRFKVVIAMLALISHPAYAKSNGDCSKELPSYARQVWEARQAGVTKEKALAQADKSTSLRPPLSDRRFILSVAYALPTDYTVKEFVMYWIGFCDGKANAALSPPPIAQTTQASTKIWTEPELKALEGRPVTYLMQVLGKPWYEGVSAMTDTRFLKWKVAIRSKLTNEITDANITVYVGSQRTVTEVSIDGGLVR